MMGRMEAGTLGAWKKVIEAVKSEGAAFLLQLWHPGSMRKVAPGHPLADYPALQPFRFDPGRPSARRAR